MFIKIFTENAHGKIELTVQELETIIADAVKQALEEKCAQCNKNRTWGTWGNSNIVPLNELTGVPDSQKIVYTDRIQKKDITSKINELLGERR